MNCRQITTFSADGNALQKETVIPVTREADEPSHLESGVINLYPNGTTSDESDGVSAMIVRGAVKYLSEDEVKELASLVYAEGYSDEPMDLLFVDGETWFIPEENVERVSEIIYG